jgi:hypothetical protein
MLLKVTAVAPVNPLPAITTVVPDGPFAGLKPVICGDTLNVVELTTVPPGATTEIFPVTVPLTIVAVICVSESTVKGTDVAFTRTSVAPVNAVPVITTTVPTIPLVGVKDAIVGVGPPTNSETEVESAPRVAFTV